MTLVENVLFGSFFRFNFPYVDAENASHSMKVVLIPRHCNHFWDDGLLCPVGAELLNELLEVVGGGLANGVHVIDEPSHAEAVQLLVKELFAELSYKSCVFKYFRMLKSYLKN